MESALSYVGKILKFFAFILFVPLTAALLFRDTGVIIALGTAIEVSFISGFILDKMFKKTELSIKSAFIIASISWMLISAIGAIPYIMVAKLSFINALFESVSGYTTTGLTVVIPEELSKALLFYRSYTEWVGGTGVVLLFIVVASPLNVASKLYMAEGRSDRLEPSIVNTASRIFYLYSLLTLFGALALYISGLSVFDSANYVFTAISTGGFATRSSSFVDYTIAEKLVVITIMILGAMSFAVHQKLFSFDIKGVFRNIEVKTMLILILIGAFFLYSETGLINALFQAASSITCTGLSTINIQHLSVFGMLIMILLMVIGGSSGSTAGGIKIVRFVVVLKSMKWYIKKLISPRGTIIPFKIGGKVLKDEEIFFTLSYVFLYFSLIIAGTLIFVKLGHPLVNSLFEIASAQGNVGLNSITGYTYIEKIVLMFHMIVGRLEIIPILVLLTSFKK